MGAATPLVSSPNSKFAEAKEAKESQTCPSPNTESSAEKRIDSLYSLTKDELEARIKLAAQAQMHYKNIVETARRLGREQAGDNGIC
jgi:hypothetical protein